jgi:proteasome assembly chaperone (PAC2) family protein
MEQELRRPWLVAAWPGMGIVGFAAATHLVGALGAQPIAGIDPHGYFDLERVKVSHGVLQRVRLPRTVFHGWRDPAGARDLLILLGEAQPAGRAYEYCEEVIRTARDFAVERIVTFAAMATVIDPRAAPRVLAVTTDDPPLQQDLDRVHVSRLEEGEIGGLNGVLLAAGAAHGLPGVCLLGEFPYFATSLPNPKASKAVLDAFADLAGVRVDTSALAAEAVEVERGLVELLERLEAEAEAASEDAEEDEEDEEHAAEAPAGTEAAGAEHELSREARARIEAVFERARDDREAALELKAELDHHGVFKKYEDRFLDLFKRAE